jgi:DNA-directed RNA polymerase beta subunit
VKPKGSWKGYNFEDAIVIEKWLTIFSPLFTDDYSLEVRIEN